MSHSKPVGSIEEQLRHENEALLAGLRGKHALTGATYATLIADRDALVGLLQQCRSRVEGMQSIQARHEHLGHTKLLAEIDEVLERHSSN
ncbi:hypothetical protein [Pseudomonas amygdali]|uniref:hypothetical protein n=1 Tax=Pseudomonas amygdali TaxID=47877 RepID=UPI000C346773|nr:hypothetical protein [Pseudomonas amygdali]PWD01893.1 hypothetical protein CX658_18175 [Pseudomonas amygdali pv. lachrymans]